MGKATLKKRLGKDYFYSLKFLRFPMNGYFEVCIQMKKFSNCVDSNKEKTDRQTHNILKRRGED